MAAIAETADLSGITESLNTILERLAAIEAEVVTKTELTVLQEKISALETGLENINSQRDTGTTASIQQRQEAAQVQPPKAVPAKPKAKPPAPAISPKPQAPTDQWVLKAAQPGNALVSAQGSEEIITLRVGDSLPGIGEIQVITQQNGSWAVIGSQGRILQ